MKNKKDILLRIYLTYFFVCVFAVLIVFKMIKIQILDGEEWRAKAETLNMDLKSIDAIRGNIYADDGSLLATSIPIFEIRLDVNIPALTDEIFNEKVDSLAYHLATYFQDKTKSEYLRKLKQAREQGNRYLLVQRNVNYNQLQDIKQFPILRRGRFKGGFIAIQQNKRERPFKVLAARTIGYDREDIKPVGLEGAYRNELKGIQGRRLEKRLAGGIWMPIGDGNEVDPQDGADIHTTINVNIQDVAQKALLDQLVRQDAAHGCVVLMEVKTGYVKAIANLSRGKDGGYYEYYNYAIGESTEPGSTFKLASVISALEDGLIDIRDTIDTKRGVVRYYDTEMTDSKKGGYGKITLQRAFEVSSNVGISKMIHEGYSKDPQRFIDRLYKMNLHEPLGLEIAGEGSPKIIKPGDSDWYGTTLTSMSIGYSVKSTPLQILSFYNAVANNGKMVKPQFVKEVRRGGRVERVNKPVVINEAICSKETIAKVRGMLEGVVENGTARNLRNANFNIAGKTGTARIANAQYGYDYDSKVSYQASFVGYFPAEDPKYSCIVVVNAPSKDVYYGNLVAGPIFKEIADKVYAGSIDIHEEIVPTENLALNPHVKFGNHTDLTSVFKTLNINVNIKSPDAPWVVALQKEEGLEIDQRIIHDEQVPNVVGMGVRDALYLLENQGLVVRVKGSGTVTKQSVQAGSKIEKGKEVILELS